MQISPHPNISTSLLSGAWQLRSYYGHQEAVFYSRNIIVWFMALYNAATARLGRHLVVDETEKNRIINVTFKHRDYVDSRRILNGYFGSSEV